MRESGFKGTGLFMKIDKNKRLCHGVHFKADLIKIGLKIRKLIKIKNLSSAIFEYLLTNYKFESPIKSPISILTVKSSLNQLFSTEYMMMQTKLK